MSKGLGCLAAVVVVVIILAVMVGGTYNRLVGLSQAVDAQWAQVESVYQRRADLIPNLVATVQGAANFEKSTLEAVTQARASVGQAAAAERGEHPQRPRRLRAFQAAQDQLSGALSRLLVVVEAYPDLKANAELPRPAGPARRARRTASPSSACATTRPRRTTTRRASGSRRRSSPACSASRRRPTSRPQPGRGAGAQGGLRLRPAPAPPAGSPAALPPAPSARP